jgi:acetyl esterase/lipase
MPTIPSTPILPAPVSVWRRITYAVKLYLFKSLLTTFFSLGLLPGFRDRAILPTFTKVYPVQPTLTNRVFVPKSYKSGDPPLPLFLDIHGGGFALGSPFIDDKFCSHFAHDNGLLVISLDYPKAPAYPFPAAVHGLVDVVRVILEDDSLPFDKKKVAIGGFSAGGNLAFAVSQNEHLRGKIGGVISYYPPVNFVTKTSEKLATRPANAGPDPLEHSAAMFNWAYVNQGQDLRDPLLSVTFIPRARLPPKIYLIGCERDMLCYEAEKMADKLAAKGTGKREGFDTCWELNGIKFEKILGRYFLCKYISCSELTAENCR